MKTEPIKKIGIKRIFWGDVDLGSVIIYKVMPQVKDTIFFDDMLLNNFYLVTLDDENSEEAWGLGSTIDDALTCAENEWNRLYANTPEIEHNPFTKFKKTYAVEDKEGE